MDSVQYMNTFLFVGGEQEATTDAGERTQIYEYTTSGWFLKGQALQTKRSRPAAVMISEANLPDSCRSGREMMMMP